MSWLDPLEPDDRLAQLLTDWRKELDDQTSSMMSTELPPLPSRPGRWVRAHRRTAAAAAVVVAIAGSTSVAAAASGSSGPLGGVHDFLYGPPAARVVDYDALQAGSILHSVESRILAARRAGSITTAERAQITARLDTVQSLLDADKTAPPALATRLAELRRALATIPAATPPQPVSPPSHVRDTTPGDDQSGSGSGGSDDNQTRGGDDGHSSGSDDSQGDDTSGGSLGGSDDGSGGSSDDSSGSGSDDGSGTGSDDGSGGDVQRQQSGDGGSDDGSVDSSETDDGSTVSGSSDSSDSGDGGGSDLSAEGDG